MKLAIHGGKKSIEKEDESLFHWPIVTTEDIQAVTDVLTNGTMSGTDITKKFEREFADYLDVHHALCFCNGTASLLASMYACNVGAGDEIIAASMSYWASAAPALMLGATVNFADIDSNTLCINPNDIEHRICNRTKAIVVTHYAGHPCPMDKIMGIAHKHNIKVIEDASHAHGGLYKGQKIGTIGDIGAMSMMAGKGLAIGEGGMIVTNNRELYERCIAFAHYERTGIETKFNTPDNQITFKYLKKYSGLPLGAMKGRINQTCSAMGRVQLRYFQQRIEEIQAAMNYFWDQMVDVPGIRPHRISPSTNSTMGAWYYPQALFNSEELNNIECSKFAEAIRAEGISWCFPGGNEPLHLHPFFHTADIFNTGKPTSISFGQRDVRQGIGTLKNSENIKKYSLAIPWFKHFEKKQIDAYIHAFKKVIVNIDLLES